MDPGVLFPDPLFWFLASTAQLLGPGPASAAIQGPVLRSSPVLGFDAVRLQEALLIEWFEDKFTHGEVVVGGVAMAAFVAGPLAPGSHVWGPLGAVLTAQHLHQQLA